MKKERRRKLLFWKKQRPERLRSIRSQFTIRFSPLEEKERERRRRRKLKPRLLLWRLRSRRILKLLD